MNAVNIRRILHIPFQYRKRYGLHAMVLSDMSNYTKKSFQYRKRYGLHAI